MCAEAGYPAWRQAQPDRSAPPVHGLALAFVLMVTALTACMPPLGDSEVDLALEDIVAGYSLSRLKTQTPRPLRQGVHYRVDGRLRSGDLYLSPQGARAGIVLVPGVVEAGKDDPRLVALAHTLARLRFAVLVPDMQGLRRLQVRSTDVTEVADALRHLLSQPEWAPAGRVGIAGFSYGAGPVLLAALEPDVRERVRFVVTLGGYHDLRQIVAYFTTGYYRAEADDRWHYLEPNRYAAWIFALSNADLLAQPEDRERLVAYLRNAARQREFTTDAPPLSGLAPDADALQNLLLNSDPAHVPALIERLSPRMRTELEGVNPAGHDLTRMRAEVILVHGRRDNMIPYTESLALARALPAERVSLFLIEGFMHVDVQITPKDIPQLRQAMQALLDQRAPVIE